MITPASERGAALLTVLLLVAVMATVSATALDRLTLATRLEANVGEAAQSRQWLGMAEQLAMTRLEDLSNANRGRTTLAGNWLGVPRTVDLPDGSRVTAKVADGGNCFNLNSLAARQPDGSSLAQPRMTAQFAALMRTLGVAGGTAANVATSASDWIDSDNLQQPGGAEDSSYSGRGLLPANRPMADSSELKPVVGMTPELFARLRPWLCALPVSEPSPLNVNTLLPEQAPLLVMLAPEQLRPDLVRAQLAARPADGFGSVLSFWKSGLLAAISVPPEAAAQVKVRTTYFRLQTVIAGDGRQLQAASLFEERDGRVRLVRRALGQADQ